MPPDKGAMGVLRVKLLNGAATRIHYGVKEFAVYDKGSQAAIITLGLPKARTMVRWGLTVGKKTCRVLIVSPVSSRGHSLTRQRLLPRWPGLFLPGAHFAVRKAP